MPVRFNPPPGWRVPPGFRPEAGWAPDPAWPPAPPGWDYWIDDAPPPPAPPAPPAQVAAPAPPAPPRRRPETPVEATTVMAPVRAEVASAPVAAARVAAPPVATHVATVGMPERYAAHPTEHATAPLPPAQPPAPPSSYTSGRSATGGVEATRTAQQNPTARPSNLLIAGVAVACIALGCILGVMFSLVKTADASQAIADAQRARDAAHALKTEVNEQQEAIDAMRAELEDREKALRDRETELAEKESQLTTRQQELDAQAAQQQQGQGAWFYWSCKDAEKAGVTPIQQGQPGYRGDLDPNGNGYACEEGEY